MGAQRGKDVLLKLDEDGSGFVTIAGIRASRIGLNADTVDVTTADSPGQWRELLGGAGVRNASVSGSGVFKDAESDAALQRVFFAGTTPDFELIVPDFGRISGPFQVTALEYAGTHDGEVSFEVSLASSGALSFTTI